MTNIQNDVTDLITHAHTITRPERATIDRATTHHNAYRHLTCVQASEKYIAYHYSDGHVVVAKTVNSDIDHIDNKRTHRS